MWDILDFMDVRKFKIIISKVKDRLLEDYPVQENNNREYNIRILIKKKKKMKEKINPDEDRVEL